MCSYFDLNNSPKLIGVSFILIIPVCLYSIYSIGDRLMFRILPLFRSDTYSYCFISQKIPHQPVIRSKTYEKAFTNGDASFFMSKHFKYLNHTTRHRCGVYSCVTNGCRSLSPIAGLSPDVFL